jgi:hypothetical protein
VAQFYCIDFTSLWTIIRDSEEKRLTLSGNFITLRSHIAAMAKVQSREKPDASIGSSTPSS